MNIIISESNIKIIQIIDINDTEINVMNTLMFINIYNIRLIMKT